MATGSQILTGLVAILHVYFLVLEMFLWTTPFGQKTFKRTHAQQIETKALAQTDATAKQKLLEEALAAFAAMQPKQDGPRRAYALYHQGRLLSPGLLGRPAEAKAMFEQAKTAGASSSELAQLIEKRLASLGAS